MKRAFVVTTVLLGLLGIVLSFEHFLGGDHYNPGFIEHPVIIGLHVILGAAYLALAMPQFLGKVRARWPALHRTEGRIAVGAGLVSGVTALAITVLFPFHGPAAVVAVGPFACFFVLALARGVRLARRGRYAAHREWMIRALAIGTAIATMRLIFVPAFLLLGEVSDERARPLSLASFVIAFTIHLAVAEAWIRSTRAAAVRSSPAAPA